MTTTPNATNLPMPTTITFEGSSLIAIAGPTPAETFVAMKPIVESMGLAWQVQHRKLMAHPVLRPCITIMVIQMPGDNQTREHLCLSLTRLPYWLATVQANRISNLNTRTKVVTFQERCADYLFRMLFGQAVTQPLPDSQPKLTQIDGFTPGQMEALKALVEQQVTSLVVHRTTPAPVITKTTRPICLDGAAKRIRTDHNHGWQRPIESVSAAMFVQKVALPFAVRTFHGYSTLVEGGLS
ncbi:MAG: anti-repressor protein Ant [Rhodospirillaceae bacterium]|nr:MAG: anti-repressor protein Ant [Rhodospirillaceae bacterium]